MNRLALFDCDGTLVDSQADICLAMEECFAAHSLPAPCRTRTRRVVGLSLVEAIGAMLPDGEAGLHAELAETYKRCFQRLRAEGRVGEPLFDGVVELLDALEEAGWLLGVATGKSDRGLRLCLERHGLAGRFVTLQTADRHPSKPHPSMALMAMAEAGAAPQSCLVIGDTSYDMAMAAAAGAIGLGAGWGYHDEAELRAAGAKAVARQPSEIVELIDA